MDDFFSQYPDFDYDSSEPIWTEFYRMSDFYGWSGNHPRKNEAREQLKDAMVHLFNNFYGTDVNDINSWHTLCDAIDIDPVPEGLQACQEVKSRPRIL